MSDVLASKVCKECDRVLPISAYHIHNGCKDGLQPKCRDCVKAYRAAYYQKNQDRLRQYSVDFYTKNADHVKNYQKEYAAKNPEKIQNRGKQWRELNRPLLLDKKRAYYEANKEAIKPKFKAYRAEHPEYGRMSCHKRKARLKQAVGTYTRQQFLAKIEYHGSRCYLCKTPLTIKELHMDHRVPLSRGGSNWPANLAPACGPCNLSKGRKTEREFRQFLSISHPLCR